MESFVEFDFVLTMFDLRDAMVVTLKNRGPSKITYERTTQSSRSSSLPVHVPSKSQCPLHRGLLLRMCSFHLCSVPFFVFI